MGLRDYLRLLFLLWLCVAAVSDARWRKVNNWLTVSGFGLGIFILSLIPEAQPFKVNLTDGVFGFCAVFFVFLIFYFFWLMGAGDVKFAAALGTWVGWELLLPIWALSCGFAVIHGLVVRSSLKYLYIPSMILSEGYQKNKKRFIPYVAYLSLATVIVLILNT